MIIRGVLSAICSAARERRSDARTQKCVRLPEVCAPPERFNDGPHHVPVSVPYAHFYRTRHGRTRTERPRSRVCRPDDPSPLCRDRILLSCYTHPYRLVTYTVLYADCTAVVRLYHSSTLHNYAQLRRTHGQTQPPPAGAPPAARVWFCEPYAHPHVFLY